MTGGERKVTVVKKEVGGRMERRERGRIDGEKEERGGQ
jgi:hypothetical protein